MRSRSLSIESPFSLIHLEFLSEKGKRTFLTIGGALFYTSASYLRRGAVSTTGTKMKGIYKGFKYTLSQMFVVKEEEPEMEIGSPTDVKHVSHIGWDGPSGTAPSWMNEFKTGSDFAATSIGNSGSALSPWSSQDFGTSIRQQQESEMYKDICHGDLPNIKKKQKRKKTKSTTSSPKSTSRSARAATKAKTNFVNGNGNPSIEVEVA